MKKEIKRQDLAKYIFIKHKQSWGIPIKLIIYLGNILIVILD